jgi:predicted nucleotidyltransferase
MARQSYLNEIKKIVLNYFQNEPVRVFIFGSRATGKAKETSDFDIGVESRSKNYRVNRKKLTYLREALEESNIPFEVDVVDMDNAGSEFKSEALKKIIYLKK